MNFGSPERRTANPEPRTQNPEPRTSLGFGPWDLGFGICMRLPRRARKRRHHASWAGSDLEREAERGNLVPRMVLGVGELRQAIELLRLILRSLINAWIQIDQVHAGRAGGGE